MSQQGSDGFEAHAAVDRLGGQRVAELMWRNAPETGGSRHLEDRLIHARGRDSSAAVDE